MWDSMVRLESSVARRILSLSESWLSVPGIETGKRFKLLRSAKQDGNWFRWVEGHAIFTEPGAKRVQTRLKRSNILVVICRKKRHIELSVICILLLRDLVWLRNGGDRWGIYGEKYRPKEPWRTPTKHGLEGDEWEPMRTGWVLSHR